MYNQFFANPQNKYFIYQQENKLKSNQQTLTYKQQQLTENENRLKKVNEDIENAQFEIDILN